MNRIITGALAALTLGGAVGATATPAAAYPYYGHGYHRGPGVGFAVGAGLAGLAVGAAIADRPYYGYPAPYAYGPAYRPYYGYAPYYGYGPYYRFHHGYYRGW